MCIRQRESRPGVIEVRRPPGFRGVTGGAVFPQAAAVRIDRTMAGKTILGRSGEIRPGARICVTLPAPHGRVFADQLE